MCVSFYVPGVNRLQQALMNVDLIKELQGDPIGSEGWIVPLWLVFSFNVLN